MTENESKTQLVDNESKNCASFQTNNSVSSNSNTTHKSLKGNTIAYLIYNVLNVIFPFITGIYVARILLPGAIGQVEAARNLAQYFVIFSFLGIPTYGLREVAKIRDNKLELSKLHSELFIINAISTSIFLSIYLGLIIFIPIYNEKLSLYLITGIAISLNFINNGWLFEGLEKFWFISIRNIIFKILSFVLLVLFVRSEDDYMIYAIITVVGTAGNYFLNIISTRKYIHFSFKGLDIRRHLKSILFLSAVNLAIEVYSLVDVTMLNIMCDDANVTYYAYGQKIYRILMQVINTFTMVLVPRIALYYKMGRIMEFNKLIVNTLKIIIILSLPTILGIWFVSDYLLVLLYGSSYINSAMVLKILSFILFVSPIGYLLGSRILLVTNNEKYMIIPVFCGAIVNIICNVVLIKLYSEVGAAIASVISEIVVMVIYVFMGKKKYTIDKSCLIISFIKVFLSLIIMFFYLYGISFIPAPKYLVTIYQILGSIVLYFGLLFILKEEIVYGVIISVKNKFFKKRKVSDYYE